MKLNKIFIPINGIGFEFRGDVEIKEGILGSGKIGILSFKCIKLKDCTNIFLTSERALNVWGEVYQDEINKIFNKVYQGEILFDYSCTENYRKELEEKIINEVKFNGNFLCHFQEYFDEYEVSVQVFVAHEEWVQNYLQNGGMWGYE